jgi:hypothetical protein
MSELVIILIFFTAIIFMYATGLMGGIPKLLKLVEQEDFDTFEFDCKKHKVAYEALLEHEEGDDLKIDLLFEHVYTAYTLKEVQAKLTEVLITQCPTASSTTASSTTAASTTASSTTASSTTASSTTPASTTASSTTPATTTASSTTPATTTASSTTPATTTASSTTPATTTASSTTPASVECYNTHEGMDTGGTDLQPFDSYIMSSNGFVVSEENGDRVGTTPLPWSLNLCKKACALEDNCLGFTFNEITEGADTGVCYFKQGNISITHVPPHEPNNNLYSAYLKCSVIPDSSDTILEPMASTTPAAPYTPPAAPLQPMESTPQLHRIHVTNYVDINNNVLTNGVINRDGYQGYPPSIIGLTQVKFNVFYDTTMLRLDVEDPTASERVWGINILHLEDIDEYSATARHLSDVHHWNIDNIQETQITAFRDGNDYILTGCCIFKLKWLPVKQHYSSTHIKAYVDWAVFYDLVSITTIPNATYEIDSIIKSIRVPLNQQSSEEVRSEYNLTINDAEKVFLDHWYSKALSHIPPIDGLPKQGMMIQRILHFGYVSFHIYFESYEENVNYSISGVVDKFKTVVDKWFSWMGLDIKVVLFGVRYASNIKGRISDLDTYRTHTGWLLQSWQKLEVAGGFNDNPWGTECGYYSRTSGRDTFKSLQDTLGSSCPFGTNPFSLPNPNFGGAEVTHHDMVFCIKGGDWTAHGQPQYLRLDHNAYSLDNVVAHEFGHSLSFDDFYDDVKYPTVLYDEDGFEHKKEDIRSIMDSYSGGVTHMDKAMLLMAMEMSGTLGLRSRWVG